VPGVRVRQVYDTAKKLKELAFLDCAVTLEYDNGVPISAQERLWELFSAESLVVPKKGKNGIQDQDIIPLIKSLEIIRAGERELALNARICCQNPSLNPMQLSAAVELHLPELKPDFAKCRRLEIYDTNQEVFR